MQNSETTQQKNKESLKEKLSKNKELLKNLFDSYKYSMLMSTLNYYCVEHTLPKHKYDRYSKFTPYDLEVTETLNLPEYINASIVQIPEHSANNKKYLQYYAFMLPKEDYFEDFKYFLFLSNIELIVSFVDIEDYYKNSDRNKTKFDYIDPEIYKMTSQEFYGDSYSLQIFDPKDNNSQKEKVDLIRDSSPKLNKTIHRLQFLKWPDHSIPDLHEFKQFLNFYFKIKESLKLNFVGIHCLAGVGRTGTFILIESLIALSQKKRVERSDVFEYWMILRGQRNGLVQNCEQLEFVLDFFGLNYKLDDNSE